MSGAATRVADLAKVSGLDLDEVLVALWEAGIDSVNSPSDLIPARAVRGARAALGLLESEKSQQSVQYWVQRGGCSREDLAARLHAVGVVLPPNSRKIPKGSYRRLRALFPDTPPEPAREARKAPADRTLSPVEWRTIGNVLDIDHLSEQDLCSIHEALTEDFQGSSDTIEPPGVRDANLLSSAAHRSRTSFGDTLKYPTVEMAAGALFHSVVLNHARFIMATSEPVWWPCSHS